MQTIIGVDIGGTKCAVVLGQAYDGGLSILEKRVFATKDYRLPEQAFEKIATEIESLAAGKDVSSIGIVCGGPLDSGMGRICSPPNLPGWDDVPICEYFQLRFSIPAILKNDADACALAEWQFGAGRGTENFVFITFGTGLGAGLILGGRLYTGKQCMAGELGHWRMSSHGPVGYGKTGSLEGFCSGGGIAQLIAQKLLELRQRGLRHPLMNLTDPPSAKDVFNLARNNDPLCLGIAAEVGRVFGQAAAMLIDLLNPEVIVAGSIFTKAYDLLHPIVKETVKLEALSISASGCRILPSELGNSIGDMAALAAALQ